MSRGGHRIGAGRKPGVPETLPRRRAWKAEDSKARHGVLEGLQDFAAAELVPGIRAIYDGTKDLRLRLQILMWVSDRVLGRPKESASLEVHGSWDVAFRELAHRLAESKRLEISTRGTVATVETPAPLISEALALPAAPVDEIQAQIDARVAAFDADHDEQETAT